LSEQATLFLLKDKLERVRKSKRNGVLAVWVGVIVAGVLWNVVYKLDFWTGFILVVGGATVLSWLINGYYGKQEMAILRQIENMSRGNVY
jgi:hypothetical protein